MSFNVLRILHNIVVINVYYVNLVQHNYNCIKYIFIGIYYILAIVTIPLCVNMIQGQLVQVNFNKVTMNN